MSIVQPKYEIGQTVYGPSAKMTEVPQTCPDCLGSKEVEVHTAGGDVFHCPCGMCSYGYFATGEIRVPRAVPVVVKLTIGSVRIDTNDEKPVSYMAVETGVGCGTLWYEDVLCNDEQAATLIATEKAAALEVENKSRFDKQRADERRKAKNKPSWEKRRIRELELQVNEFKARLDRVGR